ncbi:MAG: hypothetical protein WC490_05060 [Candidatus Margulisiibacteriota bacterium]
MAISLSRPARILGTISNHAINLGLVGASAFGAYSVASHDMTFRNLAIGTALTMTSAAVSKLNLVNPDNWIAKGIRFFGSLSPLAIAGGVAYGSYLFYQADNQFGNIMDHLGLWGTIGGFSAAALGIKSYFGRQSKAFEEAYGGLQNPGAKGWMKSQMYAAGAALLSEGNYLLARLMLLSSSIMYMGKNLAERAMAAMPESLTGHGAALDTISSVGFAALPIALPAIGFAAAWALRSKGVSFDEPGTKQYRQRRNLQIWTPLAGIAAGTALAGAQAYLTGHPELMQTYGIFWASMMYFFVAELHSEGAAMNTNRGGLMGPRSNPRVVMSEEQMAVHLRDVVVAYKRAGMGAKEISWGILFNGLIGVANCTTFYFCDSPMFTQAPVDDFNLVRTHIAHVNGLKQNIFDAIYAPVRASIDGSAPIEGRYNSLIQGLNAAAERLKTYAFEIDREFSDPSVTRQILTPGVTFDPVEREYIRANINRILAKAAELEAKANALQAKISEGWMSEDDLHDEWKSVLDEYNPEKTPIIPHARKAVRGDPHDVQKGQNVDSLNLFYGRTLYTFETDEELSPTYSGAPTLDLICGTYKRVPNPCHRYDAPAGSFEASEYIWIEDFIGLAPEQVSNPSTHPTIERVDNTPAAGEGFRSVSTGGVITVRLLGMDYEVPLDRVFYQSDSSKGQSAAPAIKDLIAKDGSTLPYTATGTFRHGETVCLPQYEHSTIVDKNDVMLNRPSVAMLESARECSPVDFAQVYWDYPWGTAPAVPGGSTESVIDANIMLKRGGRLIPYQFERTILGKYANEVHGLNVSNCRFLGCSVQIEPTDTIAGVSIRYEQGNREIEVPLRRSFWPKYIDVLVSVDDDSSVTQNPDGSRTIRCDGSDFPGVQGNPWFIKTVSDDGSISFELGRGDRASWRNR